MAWPDSGWVMLWQDPQKVDSPRLAPCSVSWAGETALPGWVGGMCATGGTNVPVTGPTWAP